MNFPWRLQKAKLWTREGGFPCRKGNYHPLEYKCVYNGSKKLRAGVCFLTVHMISSQGKMLLLSLYCTIIKLLFLLLFEWEICSPCQSPAALCLNWYELRDWKCGNQGVETPIDFIACFFLEDWSGCSMNDKKMSLTSKILLNYLGLLCRFVCLSTSMDFLFVWVSGDHWVLI